MKIFISAAEISSDIHAEKILKAIQEKLAQAGETVEWCGIGGPRVRQLPHFHAIEKAENLRTMGFIEVLKKYSYFKKLIAKTSQEIGRFQPDLILTFDYPDFHFRVMERVQEQKIAPQALRVCGIPPKVWVWRSKRVEKIRSLYHGVWVILPFEKEFYESKNIPVIYEGNPLIDELPLVALEKLPLETITVMPGSRDAELKYHLPVIPKALELFSARVGKKITAQVPVPAGVAVDSIQTVLQSTPQVEYCFLPEGSAKSLSETQIGLIKSGTSTLEAAILGCVPVIFYKMNWFSEQIFRWFIQSWGGYRGAVGLPNILLGVKQREESFFPELLGPEATPDALSEALYRLYSDPVLRSTSQKKCEEVRKQFLLEVGSRSSAVRSAERILQWKKETR